MRQQVIKENSKIYQKSKKKVKSEILNELVNILKMNRQYLSFLLRNTGRKIVFKNRGLVVIGQYDRKRLSERGRKKVYGQDIEEVLFRIWVISGFISSKHLCSFIRLNSDILFSHYELGSLLNEEIKRKLLNISAATIDRLLKKYRDDWKLKKKYKTNPFSSSLKRSIKVESWFEREKEVGSLEIDLVHHCGEKAEGQFIYTLTATEINTGWTEVTPLRNKAMVWTKNALKEIVKIMPVCVKKIHTDNGSEFINSYVEKFCKENNIKFTRSRPYKKNDAPYVESKNWTMVRSYTGWRRYDTDQQYQILKKLLKLISLKHNLFIPQMKITEKIRINGKTKKKYQIDTPLNRVLKIEKLSEETKEKLVNLRNKIDIVKLTKAIIYLKENLQKTYQTKRSEKECFIEI